MKFLGFILQLNSWMLSLSTYFSDIGILGSGRTNFQGSQVDTGQKGYMVRCLQNLNF